jgi:hypothetical protein
MEFLTSEYDDILKIEGAIERLLGEKSSFYKTNLL